LPESLSSDDFPDVVGDEPFDELSDEDLPDDDEEDPEDEPRLDEPLDVLPDDDFVPVAGVSGSLTGAGASVTVTGSVLAGVVSAGTVTVVVAGPGVAGGASSLAAGSGPFEIERPAMAFAARPTLNAIATPAVAAAVVRRLERRIGESYDGPG
jgi:hypothetical protein